MFTRRSFVQSSSLLALSSSVPLFVAQGDTIEIDTRTGEYRRRV